MRLKWGIGCSALLAIGLLAGCGDKGQTEQGDTAGAASPAAAGQVNGQQGMRDMGTMLKIKSIDGNTITGYTSSFQPGQGGRGRGNGTNAGTAPKEGEGGQAPGADSGTNGGGQASGDSAQPQGEPPGQGQNNGQGKAGGQGARGGNMADRFTTTTEAITVTDTTQIAKIEFSNNERKETALTLADLKEGDIITVRLKTGTKEAESIQVGGFGGGMRGSNGGQQAPGASPSASAAS